MTAFFMTEYHLPVRQEPGRTRRITVRLEGESVKLRPGTKTVRLVSDEPCLIAFGDAAPLYLPADHPEVFDVAHVTEITVTGY